MSTNNNTLDLFPPQTRSYILSFQFSEWYPVFKDVSIKSTIIKPLSEEFKEYLESDGVFVPVGSEDVPAESTLSDDEDDDAQDEEDEGAPSYAFPELDAKIRESVKEYGSVFPKLNFTSPRDASWLLPASSPLKCTSPSDVYMLLKSSDFVSHDLSEENVFEGCDEDPGQVSVQGGQPYTLELVLRKWYPVNPSHEVRCFVRAGRLVAISQRDTNHYDFLMDLETQNVIVGTATHFWKNTIQTRWKDRDDYIFDLLLTRDLSRAHIVDFNPYSPRSDSLLFSFEELRELAQASRVNGTTTSNAIPEFRYIDSAAHPAASRNAPVHQHNMVPFEALQLSSGQDIEGFAEMWKNEVLGASRA